MRGESFGDTLSAGQVGLALVAGLGVDAVQRQARLVELWLVRLRIGHAGSGFIVLKQTLGRLRANLLQVSRGGADKV